MSYCYISITALPDSPYVLSIDSFPFSAVFGSRSMQALSSRFLHLSSEVAHEKTLCVVEDKRLLPLNQNLQAASPGSHHKQPICQTTYSRKGSFLKETPSTRESNASSRKTGYCLVKTALPSFDLKSAKRLFPDFFPRDKLLRYHQDRVLPPDVQADPVLGSWMHLFGLQMIK